ncbi:glycosyltransferase family 2 protein [Brevibacillus brevis]|uniref:Glycosyltransferase family 2 protein n=1 Tax=Brevibacillus brevis TaxID=1393 RepID=A0A517IB08_BREBE|nr:glycosyltransferase family A protein [Brevibacillus brevis]QDS36049.1 glycosyltransferase family 2 protein [Brevibacillus brevis]
MLTSVIIPVRDAAHQLLYTLFSLNLQFADFEKYEVIVLDNCSTDGLAEKLAGFTAHYSLQVVRFRRRVSLARLFNTGIQQAKGELLIFVACNMMVPREFIGVHQQAHERVQDMILLGLCTKRIYSVYEPQFSASQHTECQKWLEQNPHIKRPHTLVKTIPLLEENQMANGQFAPIGLPCPVSLKRMSIREKYGAKLERYRSPWTMFSTQHVSLLREDARRAGAFRALPRIEMERDFAKRLLKIGCSFQFDEKLTLLKQERAIRKVSQQNPPPSKNRRA